MARLTRPATAALWVALLCLAASLAVGLRSRSRFDPMPVFLRGHQEVALEGEGPLLPVVIEERPIRLCLGVPAGTDSHGWRAELRLGAWRSQPLEPWARVTGTVCFEAELAGLGLEDGEHSLCARVRDAVDGSELRPPCVRFRFENHRPRWRELYAEIGDAMRASDPEALAQLAEVAEREGYLRAAAQSHLIAGHLLRRLGSRDKLLDAARRLDGLPSWLEDPAMVRWAGQRAYQRALLHEELGEHQQAWTTLAEAERYFAKVADSQLLGVAMKQVSLLAERGALQEAVERLQAALEECSLAPCESRLEAHARGQLAWRLPQLADIGEVDLRQAEERLASVAAAAHRDPVEQANHLINLAWVRLRHSQVGAAPAALRVAEWGRDQAGYAGSPRQALDEATALFAFIDDSEWVETLLGWKDLVSALVLLSAGELREATVRCGELVDDREGELAAWAASCAARAHRRLGEVDRAADLFDVALLLHEHLRLGEQRTRAPMGPGQRAEVFYRAARLAAETGHPEKAWEILGRLDTLAGGLVARQRCRRRAGPDSEAAWQSLDAEATELFSLLVELEVPVAGAARELRRTEVRATKLRLREILQTTPGCGTAAADPSSAGLGAGTGPDLRLFAVDDQLWAVARASGSGAARSRGVDLEDQLLISTVRRVAEARAAASADDAVWRRLVAPLAGPVIELVESLAPASRERDSVGGEIRIALHGVLQDLPLSGLPTTDGGWWGLGRTLALVPAVSDIATAGLAADLASESPPRAAGARPARTTGSFSPRSTVSEEASAPLFVVDPSSNLAGGSELLPFYRQLAPWVKVLNGSEGTQDAFRGLLPGSGWLHFDGHGHHDPAFPELSGLQLADGLLSMDSLASIEGVPPLVNLSGCRTGAWPRTAGSGRYGLGGLFVRNGAHWVVASAQDLDDGLAKAFNRAFYTALGEGLGVPRSFRRALNEVSEDYPAVLWSSLILLAPPRVSSQPGDNSSPGSLL